MNPNHLSIVVFGTLGLSAAVCIIVAIIVGGMWGPMSTIGGGVVALVLAWLIGIPPFEEK